MRKIRFQGKDFILTGETDGAITTPDAYANFETSYAHLFPNGTIKRFNKVIGTIKDIEFLDEVDEATHTELASKGMTSFLDNPLNFIESSEKERGLK